MRRSFMRGWHIPSLVVFVVAASILVGATVTAYVSISSTTESSEQVARASQAGQALEQVFTTVNLAQTTQGVYYVTQDPRYLEAYETASAALPQYLADVRPLASSHDDQQARLASLELRLDAFLSALAARAAIPVTDVPALVAAAEPIRAEGDAVRALVRDMQAAEDDLLHAEISNAESAVDRTILLTTALTGFALVVLGGMYLSLSREIRRRRDADATIQALNRDLEEHARELETANHELEQFSHSVSHDLRAPLRTIDGFGAALAEDYADELDESGQHLIRRIRNATQHMGQLIEDLLGLSRVARSDLRRESVDLTALAREVFAGLTSNEEERSIRFIVPDGLVDTGDRRLLRIVLDNLLGNAVKYTSKHEEATIEFGSTMVNGRRTYFVRDDGAGFDMHYADKLFGVFQRLHNVRDFSGTGVGLATVQRIVRRHGGEVWAEAEVEKGATFYFTLARAEAVAA